MNVHPSLPGEGECDKNANIFLRSIEAVSQVADGFAAIKITGVISVSDSIQEISNLTFGSPGQGFIIGETFDHFDCYTQTVLGEIREQKQRKGDHA